MNSPATCSRPAAAAEIQQEFWVETRRLPQATSTFYRKLDETLDSIDSGGRVREVCRPAYADAAGAGARGIDPAVYFKMLMIGFFENPAERTRHRRALRGLALDARVPRLRAGGYHARPLQPGASSAAPRSGDFPAHFFELVPSLGRGTTLLKGAATWYRLKRDRY
ncbi:MAG: hypothetical protein R3F11_10575 [Verrucomicrobiales bacterium]